MLDPGKLYYVGVGCYSIEELECWAEKNKIRIVGKEERLLCCGRVYRVDVTGNDELKLPKKIQGSVRQNLMNGTRYIGGVTCSGENVVIFPAIG